MEDTDIDDMSVTELTTAYARHDLSPLEVLEHKQRLFDQAEPVLHAIAMRYDKRESTFASAKESERRYANGEQIGPLDGVPVLTKENMNVVGEITTWGTKAFRDNPPETLNSPIIDLLDKTGCITLGKSAMPEWGMLSSGLSTDHATTCNAWNRDWNPGGSSSGAGAASAAGYAPVNYGSDIGGSVRLPASWNGSIGFKPTFGRIPVDPPYFGRTIGILGRKIPDLAIAFSQSLAADWRDPYSLPVEKTDWNDLERECKGMKIALLLDAGAGQPVAPQVAEAVAQAAQIFEQAGAHISKLAPYVGDSVSKIDMFWRAGHFLAYKALPEYRRKMILPFIAKWCESGAGISSDAAVAGSDEQLTLAKKTLAATKDYDLILSPVSPDATYPVDWAMPVNDVDHAMNHIAFCLPYNMSGQPSISVNCGFTSDGRPIGLQIAGQRYEDLTVLQAGTFYEHHKPSSARVSQWPTIWK
ncbi:amidase [Bifidobacterium sp.]